MDKKRRERLIKQLRSYAAGTKLSWPIRDAMNQAARLLSEEEDIDSFEAGRAAGRREVQEEIRALLGVG